MKTKFFLIAAIIFLSSLPANAQVRSFVGEWISPNGSNSEIKRVKISESENKVRTRIWVSCPKGVCELGEKLALQYFGKDLQYGVNAISARYDLTDKGIYKTFIFTRLPGDLLEMQELTAFKNTRVQPLMNTHTFVKTENTILPAPVLISPKVGEKVGKDNHLTLSWKPVSGAKSYEVEWHYYNSNSPDLPPTGSIQFTGAITATDKTFIRMRIDDIFHGKWRVKAIGDKGVEAETSEWREFYYELPQFTLKIPPMKLPSENAVFANSARQTVLKWTKVPTATQYGIEVQYYDGTNWVKEYINIRTKEDTLTFNFRGKGKGRWRVWSEWHSKYIKKHAFTSKSSPWRYFEHTR